MSINLKLKYFVPFDQLMGKVEILQVEDGLTVEDLFPVLAAKYRGFRQFDLFERLIVLLNGTVCKRNSIIHDGDEISVLTPLVGG